MSQIAHLIRYPGGKRRLLSFLIPHIPTAEQITGKYVEPFVGGGALFFYLNPSQALLSDINSDLIDIYCGVRYAPHIVWKLYHSFGNNKNSYHKIRDKSEASSLPERAARMLYLNRTCFKGMWRHNTNGEFNVGYGGQDRRWVITEETLLLTSKALKGIQLKCADFETVIDNCETGDFLFLDPPYRPGDKEQIHAHYVGQQFSFADHQRLASTLIRAKKRGLHWALTTSSHPEITNLFKGYKIHSIPKGTGRRPGILSNNSGEVLITSYKNRGGLN
ncbi:MAG: Dam family site-specific DNA-(adenine-N6)-methyltransferase [Acidobacteriota bacterium]